MSYSLKLGESVLKKVIGWDLPGKVMGEILAGFDRIGENPAGRLLRVGPPDDAMQFDVVAEDPGPPLRRFLFVFTVQYDADEETIHVVKCDRLLDELQG